MVLRAGPASDPQGVRQMTGKPKVLVIDDDPDFRASVGALLESRGYAVLEAASGAQGLETLVAEKPSLVVLDVMMRCDCEGYGVTHAIKHKDEYRDVRDVPVLMTSSIEQSPDDRFSMCGEAELIRPEYYLSKPLDIPRFLEIVERVCAHAAA
jgi:CheY-like chemotaxis protein